MSEAPTSTAGSTGPYPTAGPAGPGTGDSAVDEALLAVVDVDQLPLREQLSVFEAVHGALQDRLADAEG
ncbi:hypothetical protein [Cellulomonas sp. SLBN-39]|uniref:hypothetical protein n=1 Tax=Cellulomonas sp. SLBN-39 TaxID=2768446 RepID=UPI001150D521|nr:hypothetical protein [Cellulomonas sp. SLBN-39]TQL04388.1 hypothetical protein FBY24_3505 [Cellulomonas sp. SLBN-39]